LPSLALKQIVSPSGLNFGPATSDPSAPNRNGSPPAAGTCHSDDNTIARAPASDLSAAANTID